MPAVEHPDLWTLTTTLGSEAEAHSLAREIVQARLAACVQVEPGLTSFYHWEGRLCEDAEVRLTIKTLHERLPDLLALFKARHPSTLPQFVAMPAQASPDYLGWVRAELSRAAPEGGAAPPA